MQLFKVEVHLANTASSQALHWNNHKQIIKLKVKKVKNPNWREANQLAVYKRGQEIELWTSESNALTTRPLCLPKRGIFSSSRALDKWKMLSAC